MSPRSEEMAAAARRRLRAARDAVTSDPATTVSVAYYAMLYAARAALSERDLYAKTHQGTWHMFRQTFVEAGVFDAELAAAAHKTQPDREQADYEAWQPTTDQAMSVIELAERFLAAVDALLGETRAPGDDAA